VPDFRSSFWANRLPTLGIEAHSCPISCHLGISIFFFRRNTTPAHRMPICSHCQNAALWASLSREARVTSVLTFDRPSRLGKETTLSHHSDITALIASSQTCCICNVMCSTLKLLQNDPQWSVKLVENRAAFVAVLEMELWNPENHGYTPLFMDDNAKLGVCNDTSKYPGTNTLRAWLVAKPRARPIGQKSYMEQGVPISRRQSRSRQPLAGPLLQGTSHVP